MNTPRVSVIPPGECESLFERADISVVQLDRNYIPDYQPHVLERALVRVAGAMFGRPQRRLDKVRACLDGSPRTRRSYLGIKLRVGVPSDISVAAILLDSESPYGLLYEWAPGAVLSWPEGNRLVLWRQQLYDVGSDGQLTLWTDSETGVPS